MTRLAVDLPEDVANRLEAFLTERQAHLADNEEDFDQDRGPDRIPPQG